MGGMYNTIIDKIKTIHYWRTYVVDNPFYWTSLHVFTRWGEKALENRLSGRGPETFLNFYQYVKQETHCAVLWYYFVSMETYDTKLWLCVYVTIKSN